MKYEYVYYFGNATDSVGKNRLQWKGRKCNIVESLKMNSCIVEFENGERLCCSRNAIRKVKK